MVMALGSCVKWPSVTCVEDVVTSPAHMRGRGPQPLPSAVGWPGGGVRPPGGCQNLFVY